MIYSDWLSELSGIEGREIKYLRGPISTPRVPPRGRWVATTEGLRLLLGLILHVGSSQFLVGNLFKWGCLSFWGASLNWGFVIDGAFVDINH